jgi:hypothetical protein
MSSSLATKKLKIDDIEKLDLCFSRQACKYILGYGYCGI